MRKRILAAALALLICFSLVSFAFAEDWGATPAVQHPLNFRSDHKYSAFSAFIGPGRQGVFSEDGTYKNSAVTSVWGLWRESVDGVTYLYIEFKANPNYYRRVYVTNTYFGGVEHLPVVELTGKSAVVTQDCTAYYGPGVQYNQLDRSAVSAGTQATVYFEENGYVLADFVNYNGRVRAYLPASCVTAKDGAGQSGAAAQTGSQAPVFGTYCVNCGYKMPDGANFNFCPICGTAFIK